MSMKLMIRNLTLTLWLLLVTNIAFGQKADFGIRLDALPSQKLLIEQTGVLDVTISNQGPDKMFGVFTLEVTESDGFPSSMLVDLISGQCAPHPNVSPPPPGSGRFGPFVTPVLSSGESTICSLTFKLASNQPQVVNIAGSVRPAGQQPNFDPDLTNNTASITVAFVATKAIRATGTVALSILGFLMFLMAMNSLKNDARKT